MPLISDLQVLLNNAIMEFDFGDKTRGEDLFEKILLNYPSNWNVWQNYAEQFIKNNDIDAARYIYLMTILNYIEYKPQFLILSYFNCKISGINFVLIKLIKKGFALFQNFIRTLN